VRVALISDLHGNELALAAVLREIAAAGVDRLVCLGDTATLGPRPREVLAMLRFAGCPCILGNHDEFLLDPALIHTYTEAPVIVDAVDWCRAELAAADLAFVGGFVRELELDLGGGARLLLFHGSPRSNMEDLLATTPAATLDDALAGRAATVMAGGHTHLQMLRQHRGTLLVNPGSVGLPFREYAVGTGRPPAILPHAEYAIVSADGGHVAVALHRVALDHAALRAQAESCSHPLRGMLAAQY
jgi:predicted phosphodiesterase